LNLSPCSVHLSEESIDFFHLCSNLCSFYHCLLCSCQLTRDVLDDLIRSY
jgi:hypothetical protein